MIETDIDSKQDLADKIPSLRNIEGFPIGDDKDILALSEPPYYTACPNPYIADFISENGKPYDEATDGYHCEPFVGDVSEGKNDPIYNAHSYHTKVPHRAIMRYISHYTKKSDIVLDGFCGSGMTGIAAQLLDRNVILSDISPIATFISANYNLKVNPINIKLDGESLIDELKKELNWMYETTHNDEYLYPDSAFKKNQKSVSNSEKGLINYVIWSDVFSCPYCNQEFTFWDFAFDYNADKVLDLFYCKNCRAELTKKECEKVKQSHFDEILGSNILQIKQEPVLINYSVNKKRYKKRPDEIDREILIKTYQTKIPYWYPALRMPDGDESRRNDKYGLTHTHHFYSRRMLYALSAINAAIQKKESKMSLMFVLTSITNMRCNRRMPYRSGGKSSGAVNNLNIPSLFQEYNVFETYLRKLKDIISSKALSKFTGNFIVSTQSGDNLENVTSNSIDYIFTDPPFGQNIMYSELSFIWESWIRVVTNNKSEAIINSHQNKTLQEFGVIIARTFQEYYRILKPKRWLTVEFHNSKSSVWNTIQEAISKAGFIIANVSVLNKKQGSFTQVTSPGSVQNDLVISAYKPAKTFEEKFIKQAGEKLEVDFVFQFLENLPKRPSIERTDKMLYSKMLAYYIQRGYEVRQDSKSFYRLLTNNFILEDGFWFTPSQIGYYREFKQKMKLEGLEDFKQGSMMLFIIDENSALLWLFNYLSEPKTFSETSTAFTQLSEIQGDKVPDLKDMLNENFVLENNKYRRPQGEAETVSLTEKRERALMREFESLLLEAKSSKKKIAMIRKEAVLYGFEVCYKQNRFEDMLTLVNRLDSSILENSTELTDFVEIARIKVEGIK